MKFKNVEDMPTLQIVADHLAKKAVEAEKDFDKLDLNHEDSQWTEGLKDGYAGAATILQHWIDSRDPKVDK